MDTDEPPAGVRFKSKKRTKTLRQRDASPVAESSSTPTATAAAPARDTSTPADDDDVDSTDASAVQAALKLRQARKNRFRGGVGYGRDEPGAVVAAENAETGLVLRESAAAQGLPDRFMHQTGFVADADDKHMYVLRL